jgi:regulator of protease activity HflC (stomatin/prohibitin superfamily)
MSPRIQEDVKAVFTKYTAENLIGARATLADQVKDLLLPYMNEKGIKIVSVAIENIDFTDAFTNAVEEKQVALQTKLRVETEQAQQVSVEKASAERKVISANADASVQKINADAAAYTKTVQATAEAEANKKIASSLTEPLIEYWKINKWNGTVPQFQSGGTGTSIFPVIDMTNQG